MPMYGMPDTFSSELEQLIFHYEGKGMAVDEMIESLEYELDQLAAKERDEK